MKYCIKVMVWNGKGFDPLYGPFNSFRELYARWGVERVELEQEYYTEQHDTELVFTGFWKCWVRGARI